MSFYPVRRSVYQNNWNLLSPSRRKYGPETSLSYNYSHVTTNNGKLKCRTQVRFYINIDRTHDWWYPGNNSGKIRYTGDNSGVY